MSELTTPERTILALERRRWKYEGAKMAAVHAELGLTPTRYYAALNRLLDDPAAELVDPPLVRRLQRLRDARRAARRAG